MTTRARRSLTWSAPGLGRAPGLALALALVSVLGCKAGADTEASAGEGEGEAPSEQGEDETTGEPPIGDGCETTPWQLIAPSRTRSTLRDASPSPIPAACGIDGPVVFFDLHVDSRIDLGAALVGRAGSPKLAIMRPGCLDSGADPSRVLACAEALPTTLLDIGPETRLTLAVGLGLDDPALALDPASEAHDPLEFELALTARVVLDQGEVCGQPNTRCEPGTVCLSEAELGTDPETGTGTETGTETGAETGGELDDTRRCVRPEADSCVAPGELSLELDLVHELLIPPDEPHSDAHEHACTGWRRPERVERLILPPDLPAGAELVIRADDGRVGLALRGPSCLVEDALACAAAGGPDETFLVWGGEALAAAAASDDAPLLFIELPRADGAEPPLEPITVELEIVSG